jgi:hypothetical protein
VAPGEYWVRIQDFSSCSEDFKANAGLFTNPAFFDNLSYGDLSTSNACDSEANGSINVSGVTGGDPNYVYALYNNLGAELMSEVSASTSFTFNDLVPGSYTVVVTDQTNCNKDLSIPATVGNYSVTIDHHRVIKSEPTCNGGTNGTINLVSAVSGPSGATYEYQFDEVNTPGIERPFGSSPNFSGAFAGNWTVTVRTTGSYCGSPLTASESCTISEPAPIVVEIIPVAGGFNSNVKSGGTAPYVYNWMKDNVVFSFSTSITAGLAPGETIQLNVTDANLCVGTAYYTQPALSAAGRPALTAYPNPNFGGEITLEYNQDFQFDEEFVIEAVDLTGRPLGVLQNFVLQRSNEIVVDLSDLDLPDASYFLTVRSQYEVYQTIKVLRKE